MTAPDVKSSLLEQKAADEISETDLHEPTKVEILADVKIGLQQALAGERRQAREVFAEMRQKLGQDADRN